MKRLMDKIPVIIESSKVSRDDKKVILSTKDGKIVFDGGMPKFSIIVSDKTSSVTVDDLEDVLAFAHSVMKLLIGSFGIEDLSYLDEADEAGEDE